MARLSGAERLKIRIQARSFGWLKKQRVLSEAVAAVQLARAAIPGTSTEARVAAFAKAAGRAQTQATRRRVRHLIQPYLSGPGAEIWRARQIGWARYYGEFGELATQKEVRETLVLKTPGPGGERGVLYCPFEYNWMRILAHSDARALLADYFLVAASSSSPTDYAALANFAGLSEHPIFVGISNKSDLAAYRVLHPVIKPVPVMASDLSDPAFFEPRPDREREIDILMVANWLRLKRHWLLFEALRELPRSLRVVLVGRNADGRTEREIRSEARAFGVKQDIEYHTNIPVEQVAALQCNARLSAVLSYREGSCVAIAESLFADTPVVMMHDAHVGAKAYVNHQTGALVSRRGMARQLHKLLEQRGRYTPREWALANISCHIATERLNRFLRGYSERAGLPWCTDLLPFCIRYTPEYLRREDARSMAPVVEELEARYGLRLGRHAYTV
jgi:glycosyltransferase involved in cell wall biosynthesis